MTEPRELDRIRHRWCDQHRRLGLPHPSGPTDVLPAGLGRRVDDLSTRVVILPGDPMATLLEFDDEFWDWWAEGRPAPFGSSLPWDPDVPSVDAAVRVRSDGNRCTTFLAVHRHGGVEVGTADSYEVEKGHRNFRLIRTVGLLWVALDSQAQVLRHVDLEGPWEVTLAMYRTQGAQLGDLGAGWSAQGNLSWFAPVCLEPNVVIRQELERWPEEPDDLRELAFRLGGHIEDAWGIRYRRFLDHHGEFEGQFDARRFRL